MNKKNLFKLLTLCLMFALVFVAAGCSSDEGSSADDANDGQTDATDNTEQQQTEITFWAPFSGADGEFMKDMVDQFNKEHEGEAKVKMTIVPQTEYYRTIDLALAGDQKLPNIMIAHADQIPNYAAKGLFEDLTQFSKDAGLTEDDFPNTIWDYVHYDGKQYGIPLDIHPLVFYWNKDMFEAAGLDPNQPPTTREEFLEYAEALTDVDNGEYGFVVPTLWPQQFIFPTLLYQNGGQLADAASGEITFNSAEGVEALQFMIDLVNKYQVSPKNVQQDGEVTLFNQGKNAMHLNGPWMKGLWDDTGLNYGVAPVPTLGTERQAVYGNGHTFVIPADRNSDQESKAAQAFMNWIASNSIDWAKSGQAPASVEVRELEEFKSMKQPPKVAEQFGYTEFSPKVPKWGQISSPLWEEINLALLGKKDAKTALDDAAKRAQQILDEMK
jgi:multiple sugar transport system substrate-binding protein